MKQYTIKGEDWSTTNRLNTPHPNHLIFIAGRPKVAILGCFMCFLLLYLIDILCVMLRRKPPISPSSADDVFDGD